MLEMFFDNEKSFSVFELLLRLGAKQEYLTPADIGLRLEMEPHELFKVLTSFEMLNMVEFKNPLEFKVNVHNPILIGVCILDDLVAKYYMDTTRDEKENGDFQQIIKDNSDISLEEFVEMLKKL